MSHSDTFVQDFNQLARSWSASRIIRHTWNIHRHTQIQRDLEIWLSKDFESLDPTRLIINAYDVSEDAFSAMGISWPVYFSVTFKEGKYFAFSDFAEGGLLFTCRDFTYAVLDVAYDSI